MVRPSAARASQPTCPRRSVRYRFYTSATDIDADLQAWLRYYKWVPIDQKDRSACPATPVHRVLTGKAWG